VADLDLDAIEALLLRRDPIIDHILACDAYWSRTADGKRGVECQCGHDTILAALPALVAEVRRLRAVRDAAEKVADILAHGTMLVDPSSDGWEDALDELDLVVRSARQADRG